MSKSYVPNHSELVLTVKKWLDDVWDMYCVDFVDTDGVTVHLAIDRLATLLGDELEAFEDKTAEAYREDGFHDGYDEGYQEAVSVEREQADSEREVAFQEGYEQGYDKGYAEAELDHDIRTDY